MYKIYKFIKVFINLFVKFIDIFCLQNIYIYYYEFCLL